MRVSVARPYSLVAAHQCRQAAAALAVRVGAADGELGEHEIGELREVIMEQRPPRTHTVERVARADEPRAEHDEHREAGVE